jgi:hypothetical protein
VKELSNLEQYVLSRDAPVILAAAERGKIEKTPCPQAGLSMYHIPPQAGAIFTEPPGMVDQPQPYNGWGEKKLPKAKVTFRRKASLVACDLGQPQRCKGKRHEWMRGKIKEFSKGARRRALRLVASLRREIRPTFATLTYPDLFDTDPRRWKRDLEALFKRILHRWPAAVIIWKMEPKERKTGQNKGNIAPHFHLLIYNVPWTYLVHWMGRAWWEVVGSGNPDHLAAGTRVEAVRSVRGVLNYTAKYICKSESANLPGWGRYWGVVNRQPGEGNGGGLPALQGKIEVIELDPEAAKIVLRYMRHLGGMIYDKRGKYIGRRKVPKWGTKYTLICDAEFWYEKLPGVSLGNCGIDPQAETRKYCEKYHSQTERR